MEAKRRKKKKDKENSHQFSTTQFAKGCLEVSLALWFSITKPCEQTNSQAATKNVGPPMGRDEKTQLDKI